MASGIVKFSIFLFLTFVSFVKIGECFTWTYRPNCEYQIPDDLNMLEGYWEGKSLSTGVRKIVNIFEREVLKGTSRTITELALLSSQLFYLFDTISDTELDLHSFAKMIDVTVDFQNNEIDCPKFENALQDVKVALTGIIEMALRNAIENAGCRLESRPIVPPHHNIEDAYNYKLMEIWNSTVYDDKYKNLVERLSLSAEEEWKRMNRLFQLTVTVNTSQYFFSYFNDINALTKYKLFCMISTSKIPGKYCDSFIYDANDLMRQIKQEFENSYKKIVESVGCVKKQ